MAKIKPSAAKKGTRLGTQMRGGLQKAYNQRGPGVAHLFHSYSLKAKRDVVLTGGLQFLHMLHAESDPLVVNVDYSPRVPGSDRDEDSGIDVEALIRGGTLELRTIRTHERADSEPERARAAMALRKYNAFPKITIGQYQTVKRTVYTEQQLIPGHEIRICNWHRILVWYARVKYHSLAHARRVFEARLADRGSCGARDVLALGSTDSDGALMMAAAIEAVAYGRCESNLNEVTFGGRTRFFLKGRD